MSWLCDDSQKNQGNVFCMERPNISSRKKTEDESRLCLCAFRYLSDNYVNKYNSENKIHLFHSSYKIMQNYFFFAQFWQSELFPGLESYQSQPSNVFMTNNRSKDNRNI